MDKSESAHLLLSNLESVLIAALDREKSLVDLCYRTHLDLQSAIAHIESQDSHISSLRSNYFQLHTDLAALQKTFVRASTKFKASSASAPSADPPRRFIREKTSLLEVVKLGSLLDHDHFDSWFESLGVYARVLEIQVSQIPLDKLMVTLEGRALTLIRSLIFSAKTSSSSPPLTTTAAVAALRAATVEYDKSHALASYAQCAPSPNDSWHDLKAKFTMQFRVIFTHFPRAMPAPREHLRTFHNSLPTHVQTSLSSALHTCLELFQEFYPSTSPADLMALNLQAQDTYCDKARILFSSIPSSSKAGNAGNSNAPPPNRADTGGRRVRTERKYKGKLAEPCRNPRCSHLPNPHILKHCHHFVGGVDESAVCAHCGIPRHRESQCRKLHGARSPPQPAASAPTSASSSASPPSLPNLGSMMVKDLTVAQLHALTAKHTNHTSTPTATDTSSSSTNVELDLDEDCVVSSTVCIKLSGNFNISSSSTNFSTSADSDDSIGGPSTTELTDVVDFPLTTDSIGDTCKTAGSAWSSIFPFGVGSPSHVVEDCLLDTGGLVKGWSYMSAELLAKIPQRHYTFIDLPPAQLRGVGADSKPILFSRAVKMPIYMEGVLAKKPSEKRISRKFILLRITPRCNMHHDVVFNEGDASHPDKLGITMQLPTHTAWWHHLEGDDSADERIRIPTPTASKSKVVPALLARASAAVAERVL